MTHPHPRNDPATLADLLAVAPAGARLHAPAGDAGDPALVDVTHDSRTAGAGVLFACRPGQRADGHDFAAAAVAAGSPALLVQRPLPLPVPQLAVPSVADALGPVAARVHGDPSTRLALCGVTGTNGKTTTVYLLEAALRAAGHTTGLIGTVETLVAGRTSAGLRTTPESTDLQRLLARMCAAGVGAAAMEVSSHGLALGRVRGTRFALALFTNLTQDHLDFHGSMERYFAAKAALFAPEYTGLGLVNVDDPFGRRLAGAAAVRLLRVSASGAWPAEAVAEDVRLRADGSSFRARVRGRRVPAAVRLPGDFNVANALCALAAAHELGADLEAARDGIAGLRGVPGRMERVDLGQPFGVLVDYAHTPDALLRVLGAARRLTRGRLLVVVGCGGERDQGKRTPMGQTAAEMADLAVLTSDNPRGEEPAAILRALADGARRVPGARYLVEPDRRAAIATALAAAGPGDMVVVAGKGHETYQQVGSATLPFDDRAVARELLAGGAAGQRQEVGG